MTLFDNATNVVIGNKEVASIKIGETTLYEKSKEATTHDIVFCVRSKTNAYASGRIIKLLDSNHSIVYTSSRSEMMQNPYYEACAFISDVVDGEYYLQGVDVVGDTEYIDYVEGVSFNQNTDTIQVNENNTIFHIKLR